MVTSVMLAGLLAGCITSDTSSSPLPPANLTAHEGDYDVALPGMYGAYTMRSPPDTASILFADAASRQAYHLEFKNADGEQHQAWIDATTGALAGLASDTGFHYHQHAGIASLEVHATMTASSILAAAASGDHFYNLNGHEGTLEWVTPSTLRLAFPLGEERSDFGSHLLYEYHGDEEGRLKQITTAYLKDGELQGASALLNRKAVKDHAWPAPSKAPPPVKAPAESFVIERWPSWGQDDTLLHNIGEARRQNEELDAWMSLGDDWVVHRVARNDGDRLADEHGTIESWHIDLARENQTFRFILEVRHPLLPTGNTSYHVRSWAGDAESITEGYRYPTWRRPNIDLEWAWNTCIDLSNRLGIQNTGMSWLDQRYEPGQRGMVGGKEILLGGGYGAQISCFTGTGAEMSAWLRMEPDTGLLRTLL